MKIQKWNKVEKIFVEHLDDIYKSLPHCEVYYIKERGFAVLNHQPKYGLYKKMNIPEIQDVLVLPSYRGQGIATTLISHCETIIEGGMIGISVPVSTQFGAAQRLYFKLGYEPDGQGVTYDRMVCPHNSMVQVDDDCCLMLIKQLW